MTRPLVGLEQAGDHLDGGAFAGAVGSQVAEDLTGAKRKADAIHGWRPDEGLGQIEGFKHG